MKRNELNDHLLKLVDQITQTVLAEPRMQHISRVQLPNKAAIIEAIGKAREVLFPGYFGKPGLTRQNLEYRIGELVLELSEILFDQVLCCLRYRQSETSGTPCDDHDQWCESEAARIIAAAFDRIPAVRELLASDVEAAFEGDPAAHNTDETIFCYPGLFAITVQRLAHEFYKLNVPLLPRIMTEHAHSQTGIDIHPGAQLGQRFFIDHGTGVVIGETTVIGNNVKIYQGVTLGALAPAYGQALRGEKRHPTIEDNVTIYAGATILGGFTVIGEGSVIGGNVFLTSSVPPHNQVSTEAPKLKYREKRRKGGRAPDVVDFQI